MSASAFAAALILATGASAIPVITNGSVITYAHDNATGTLHQNASLNGLGTQGSSAASGSAQGSTAAVFSADANTVTLDYSFSHAIGAPHPISYSYYDWWYGWVSGHQGDIYAQSTGSANFTLGIDDVGYTYAMAASYVQDGTSQAIIYASLYDQTANQQLFYLNQGYNTPGTDVTLSLAPGGNFQQVQGSASGNLVAGHAYSVVFYTYVRHWNYGSSPFVNAYGETAADASGRFTLTLQGPEIPEAVPEPGTLALMGLGLMGLLAFARRRR